MSVLAALLGTGCAGAHGVGPSEWPVDRGAIVFQSHWTSTPCNGPCATGGLELRASGELTTLVGSSPAGRATVVLDHAKLAEARALLAARAPALLRTYDDATTMRPPPPPNDLHVGCAVWADGRLVVANAAAAFVCESTQQALLALSAPRP